MNEVPTRKHVEAHAKAVVEGDMDTVTNDFAPELRGSVSDIAKKLPQPVTDAEVTQCDVQDDHADVRIRYSNDEKQEHLTIQTRWEEIEGRPMIVDGKPLEDD
jgi:hypothetical protein